MPAAATMASVPSRVMPMKPTFTPPTSLIQYGGRTDLRVPSFTTFAASHWKSAPA